MRQFAFALLLFFVAGGCALVPGHQFLDPSRDWTARNGQMSYHGKRRTIIGEVLVRFSKRGDFELTFTKGPGLSLLVIRSDPDFARLQGAMVGIPWSGKIAEAPVRVRGWLKLREEILHSPAAPMIRVSDGGDTFVLRF